jgi:hypothetical protein
MQSINIKLFGLNIIFCAYMQVNIPEMGTRNLTLFAFLIRYSANATT